MFPTTKPATNIQWGAIQNGANSGSLVSQLYAAKPPVTNSPSVTAASSAVPNQNAPVKNPFSTPASTAAGNVGTGIASSLARNTQPFSPATVGTFNTTPAPTPAIPQPQMSSNVASLFNTPAQQTTTVSPATQETNAVSTGVTAPTPPPASLPTYNPNAPIVNPNAPAGTPLTQTGQTAATLANTAANGSPAEQTAENALENTSAQGSSAATAAQQATANAGLLNPAIGAEAATIGSNYGNEISTIGEQAAGMEGVQGGGGLLPNSIGAVEGIQNEASAKQSALAAGESAALQGTSQQLTAAQQEASAEAAAGDIANTQQANIQSGETSAAGAANTAQSNVQSGEQAAGSLTAPSGNFPFSYNPATGTFSNASPGSAGATGGVTFTGNPTTDASTAAQAVINGQMTYAQAQQSMSYAGSAANNYLNSAILAAGGNPENLEAQGAAQQQDVTTAGTAQTNIANSGLTTTTQTYNDANAAYSTAMKQAQNVQNILSSTGINASDSQDWNSAVNSLSARLGSANQAQYIAGLAELQTVYTNLLSSTGAATPTVNGQQAIAIFNPSSTPSQIDAAITALNNAAYAKLQPMYQEAQQYQSSLNSSTSNTSSTASPGGFAWNPSSS